MAPYDILKAILLGTVVTSVVLLWVHRSHQTKVSRSVSSSIKIAARLIAVYAAAVGLLCGVLRIPVDVLFFVFPFVLLLTSIVSLEEAPADALAMTLVVPFYVLQQFVLGFPDRDSVVLVPPEFPRNQDPPAIASDTGVVVAILRPMGRIELAGETFSAASADGKMLDVGTPIRVCGNRGQVLLVTKLENEVTAG